MRVAMVFGQANPMVSPDEINEGAAAAHVVELSRVLSRRGHEVRIFTRRDTSARKAPAEIPIGDGVVVEPVSVGPAKVVEPESLLPYMGDLGRTLAARWADGPFRPDIVHAHTWLSGLAALTATANSRIPVVVTYHELGSVRRRYEGDQDPSPGTRIGLERTLANVADRVIALSEDILAELNRIGVHRPDMVVVPSGVDVDVFTPGPAEPKARNRILTVGRLVERKGFADLIAALPLVPDAELVIVGGPPRSALGKDPAAKRLRELAERAGVADRVQLVGRVARADMPTWYRSADVVACATWYGAAPLVPLEAMACGVPVVAYGLGGMAESVIDGVTGVLVPARDVRDLAWALRSLLRDNVRRMSLSSAAVDRVRSRYTWDRAAFDTERAYSRVLGAAELEPAESEPAEAETDEDEAFTEASASS